MLRNHQTQIDTIKHQLDSAKHSIESATSLVEYSKNLSTPVVYVPTAPTYYAAPTYVRAISYIEAPEESNLQATRSILDEGQNVKSKRQTNKLLALIPILLFLIVAGIALGLIPVYLNGCYKNFI